MSKIKIEPNRRPDFDISQLNNDIASNLIKKIYVNPSILVANVGKNTQASVNMTHFGDLGDPGTSDEIYTRNRLNFHLQKSSNLCHSSAVLTVLRHCLIHLLELMISKNPSENFLCENIISYNL